MCEYRSVPTLVEHLGDHARERLGLNVALLTQLVEVHAELELLVYGLNVCGKAREAQEDFVIHAENLTEAVVVSEPSFCGEL